MGALSNERIAYFNGNYVPEKEVLVPFATAAGSLAMALST